MKQVEKKFPLSDSHFVSSLRTSACFFSPRPFDCFFENTTNLYVIPWVK